MAKKIEQSEFSSFETEFERLGEIVSKLEEGNISLDDMMKLYEEGTKLASRLSGMLKAAELRVERLAKVHEELSTFELEPFDDEG